MKLFVTDYDETLYVDDNQIKNTMKKIKKLKENGFMIVIATGRSYPSIHNQVSIHNVYYDYLICADGSIIYDKDNNVLETYPLNKKIVEPYVKFYQNIDYEEIQFSYPEGYSNIYKDGNLIGINICIATDKFTDELVNKFLLMSKDFPEYNFLNYKHPNHSYLCVKPKGISKSSGINYLKELLNVNYEDIYVIGDSSNDYEMIRDFNGSCVSCANELVKSISKKVYRSIDNYIDDILYK